MGDSAPDFTGPLVITSIHHNSSYLNLQAQPGFFLATHENGYTIAKITQKTVETVAHRDAGMIFEDGVCVGGSPYIFLVPRAEPNTVILWDDEKAELVATITKDSPIREMAVSRFHSQGKQGAYLDYLYLLTDKEVDMIVVKNLQGDNIVNKHIEANLFTGTYSNRQRFMSFTDFPGAMHVGAILMSTQKILLLENKNDKPSSKALDLTDKGLFFGSPNNGFGLIKLSPDGKRLIIWDNNAIHGALYDLTTMSFVKWLKRGAATSTPCSTAFSPDNRFCAFLSTSDTLHVFDLESTPSSFFTSSISSLYQLKGKLFKDPVCIFESNTILLVIDASGSFYRFDLPNTIEEVDSWLPLEYQ